MKETKIDKFADLTNCFFFKCLVLTCIIVFSRCFFVSIDRKFAGDYDYHACELLALMFFVFICLLVFVNFLLVFTS